MRGGVGLQKIIKGGEYTKTKGYSQTISYNCARPKFFKCLTLNEFHTNTRGFTQQQPGALFHHFSTKAKFSFTSQNIKSQSKYYSTEQAATEEVSKEVKETEKQTSNDEIVVYNGFSASTVKFVKKMSVFGSVVSVILCPILILLGDATVPLAGRITIASIVGGLGIGSTGGLHLFTRPYVSKICVPFEERFKHNPLIDVYTIDILAREKKMTIPLHEFTERKKGAANFEHVPTQSRFLITPHLIEPNEVEAIEIYFRDKMNK